MDAQETRIFTAVLITAFVLGIIITYFLVSMIRHHKKNLELQKLSIKAEITQIEKERARIAHDLHDELGPILAAVKMKISSFDISQGDKSEMIKTNDHIDGIIKRIREISFNLMPSSLLRKGVATAIKEFVDLLNNNTSIKFYFECENDLQVSEQKSINIYRIVQEIVHNTIKHSKASVVNIELKKINNDLLLLEITDNGIGFNYQKESEENSGFGLKSLLRRTEVIGGAMFLDSKIGKGTTYSFEIPLQ